MKIKIKSIFISFCLMVMMFSTILSVNLIITKANNTANNFSEFKMEEGAAVYIRENINGMRFRATVKKDEYDKIQSQDVAFGTFILPLDYVIKLGEPNVDRCFGENPIYVWGDCAASDNQYKILHTTSKISDGENGLKNIDGSVINMLNENLDREYIGYSYAKITVDGIDSYQFATQKNENARTILEVAGKAYHDPNTKETIKPILLDYKTRYAETNGGKAEFNYTVNYVVDGKLDETITEQKSAEIWSDISVTEDNLVIPNEYAYLSLVKSNSMRLYSKDDVVTVNCTGISMDTYSKMEVNSNEQMGSLKNFKYEQRIVDGEKIWIDPGTKCLLMTGRDGVYVKDGIANTYVAAKYQIGENNKFQIVAKGNDRGNGAFSNSNLRVRIVDVETKIIYKCVDWKVTSGKLNFQNIDGEVNSALANKEVMVLVEEDSCYDGSKGDNYAGDTMWVWGIKFYK